MADHTTISRSDRYRLALTLYSPLVRAQVAQIQPTVAAFLNNYLHRAVATIVWTNGEWLADHARFCTTDNMTGYGPISVALPLLNITAPALEALSRTHTHTLAVLIEAQSS